MFFSSSNNTKDKNKDVTVSVTVSAIAVISIIVFTVGLIINYNISNIRLGTNLQVLAFICMGILYYIGSKSSNESK